MLLPVRRQGTGNQYPDAKASGLLSWSTKETWKFQGMSTDWERNWKDSGNISTPADCNYGGHDRRELHNLDRFD
jgi:hypothetical protein